jgi:hypothetical protein
MSNKCSWCAKSQFARIFATNEGMELKNHLVKSCKAKIQANQQFAKRTLKINIENWKRA